MRHSDSAYDRSFTNATERLLQALRRRGHTVETPVTGNVIVNGVELTGSEWDNLAAFYDGEASTVDEVLAAIGL